MSAVHVLLDLVYPSRCIVCRELMGPEPPGICPACLAAMPAPEEPKRRVEFVDRKLYLFSYTGKYRDAMLRYKFGRRQLYGFALGRLLGARIQSELAGQYDLISWVPLHPLRKLRRGFDQSRLLAKAAGKVLGLRPQLTLRKVRNTLRQSSMPTASARRANISGAYRVVHPEQFRGKRILLIDDILTTGSTVSEAARTLLTAGAAKVHCAAPALTPKNRSR